MQWVVVQEKLHLQNLYVQTTRLQLIEGMEPIRTPRKQMGHVSSNSVISYVAVLTLSWCYRRDSFCVYSAAVQNVSQTTVAPQARAITQSF